MNCDAANWTEVNLNCKVRIQVIIDARIEMFVPYHIFVIRSHQNFQSVKTAMTVAIHLLSVSNRDNIQYSEDISQVGVAMMSITKKMTRQLSQPFVLSQTRAG